MIKEYYKGFTLLELLIALLILGILTALVLPAYQYQIRKARRSDAITSLLKIQQEQEKWRANHTTYGTLTDVWSGTSSLQGYYTMNAFTGVSSTGYTATATATTAGGQSNDTNCTTFTLTQAGPDVSTATKKDCWGQ